MASSIQAIGCRGLFRITGSHRSSFDGELMNGQRRQGREVTQAGEVRAVREGRERNSRAMP